MSIGIVNPASPSNGTRVTVPGSNLGQLDISHDGTVSHPEDRMMLIYVFSRSNKGTVVGNGRQKKNLKEPTAWGIYIGAICIWSGRIASLLLFSRPRHSRLRGKWIQTIGTHSGSMYIFVYIRRSLISNRQFGVNSEKDAPENLSAWNDLRNKI
ncbi:hypothetical protein PLICRDRAFT_606514 [Plicaturopsis crispa FD-325 SS-3]|nr:hypothetical protein PLICRDRAFT_606514 [Plicaturopsis crispa FD-325 SS-3]